MPTARRELLGAGVAAGMLPAVPSFADEVTILDKDAQVKVETFSPAEFILDAVTAPIKEPEVLAAQRKWAQGIVDIGKLAGGSSADYTKRAAEVIDTLYGFESGPVLFKPTKASAIPFRLDRTGALSYFVSGNSAFPEDKGFALKPWTAVRFENDGILLEGPTALAQGNYFFTGTDGSETKVEYTFGYFRDSKGQVRINLHHSSLPFKPAA